MEFEPSSVIWKSRGRDAVVGTSVVNGKEGSKLVLVTTQSEVVEFCTQTRKCVNHWTFRTGSSAALRLAAVRNPISQTYFGVRAAKKAQGESLVSWKQSDLDVSKWKKTTNLADKTTSVFGLFTHPQLPEDVVVVYENARFESYDDALTRVFDSSASTEENELVEGKVVWASLASSHRNPAKGALLLSLLVQSKTDAAQYELVVYRIVPTKERRDARVTALLQARHTLPAAMTTAKGASVVSCAFHAETQSYSVILSTGEWHMVYFRHDAMSNSIEFTSTKKITTFTADLSDENATPVQKKRKLSNAGSAASSPSTSAQFVAGGVGPFSYLVVASPLAPQKLVGWDSKFGVQVVSTEVKTEKDGGDASSGPMPAKIGQIRSLVSSLHGETVVAAYDHAVFLLNVKNKHSTLASVLGVYSSASQTVGPAAPALPNSSINWADVAGNKVQLDQWQKTLCSDDAQEQQLLSELVDASLTTTTAAFQKKFDAAIKKLGGKDKLSYRFLLAATRRCVDSADSLALWAPLKVLLQSKRLSARATPALLPTLMKHNQFDLLELALTHLSDIDERSIVRLLRFFIRKSDDKTLCQYVESKTKKTTKKASKKSTDKKSQTPSSERFVVALLALPTNSVFLHHAIRELQLSEVLFLLAICKKFFYSLEQTSAVDQNDDAASAFFTALPSSTQFCAWICALIDGHVAQLVLTASKDASVASALQQLDALVQAQLASCERFEGVHNVVGNFLEGVKLPQAHGMNDYSIEELTI